MLQEDRNLRTGALTFCGKFEEVSSGASGKSRIKGCGETMSTSRLAIIRPVKARKTRASGLLPRTYGPLATMMIDPA